MVIFCFVFGSRDGRSVGGWIVFGTPDPPISLIHSPLSTTHHLPPKALAVLGEINLAETMAAVDPAVIAEAEAAASASTSGGGAGKKKGKKAGNSDAAAESSGAAEAGKKKAKKEDPMKNLPPTSMKLDDFKKLYSNNDTRAVVIPQFWSDMWDPSGYAPPWRTRVCGCVAVC